jgi:hypothetical protein
MGGTAQELDLPLDESLLELARQIRDRRSFLLATLECDGARS